MHTSALSNPTVVLTLAAFGGLAIALTFAVIRSWQRPTKWAPLQDALEVIQSSELDIDTALNKDHTPREGWTGHWLRLVENSGRVVLDPATPGRFIAGLAFFAALGGFLIFPGGMLGLLLAPIVIIGGAHLFLRGEARKRIAAMETQLPHLLSSLRANLQAGSTEVQALIAVADDLPAPLGDEMRLLKRDLNVNMDFAVALQSLSSRVASRDMKFLVSSIQIAIAGGADLEPQLATIEMIVAQRTRIRGKLRAAAAQVKPTQLLAMCAVPFMFFFSVTAQGNGAFWATPLGILLLILAAALYAVGVYLIHIMVKGVENS